MSVLGAILLVLAGLAIMAFGIFLFYAWLPFLYGLFGLEIGLLLGQWLTGDIGLLAIILGIVGAVILFGAAYLLEPYRRVLLGFSAGALVGLSIASFLGLDHFVGGVLGAVLAVVGAIIGAIIVPRYFDAFVIVACVRRSRHGYSRRTLAFPGYWAVRPCRWWLYACSADDRFECGRHRLAIQDHRQSRLLAVLPYRDAMRYA